MSTMRKRQDNKIKITVKSVLIPRYGFWVILVLCVDYYVHHSSAHNEMYTSIPI